MSYGYLSQMLEYLTGAYARSDHPQQPTQPPHGDEHRALIRDPCLGP